MFVLLHLPPVVHFLAFFSFPLKYILHFRFDIFKLNFIPFVRSVAASLLYISFAFFVNYWHLILSVSFIAILTFLSKFVFHVHLIFIKAYVLFIYFLFFFRTFSFSVSFIYSLSFFCCLFYHTFVDVLPLSVRFIKFQNPYSKSSQHAIPPHKY